MTFSIIGYCQETKMTGVAITTSSICVASRCPWVRAGVGAVATQNITNPSLGPYILDLMAQGYSPQAAIDEVVKQHQYIQYRQLTAINCQGDMAHFTGSEILGTHRVVNGKHCISAGNLLSSEAVPQAMSETFDNHPEQHLAERLLMALKAGVDAGGEEGPTHSAGLKVAHQQQWPLVDLRVDWSEQDPVDELFSIWHAYEPQMHDYTLRAIAPHEAPSCGVPGDE